tara:strand:- start:742 stop:1062 length:321 start_codon:yes stop_codon:yes gene_type:complete
MALMNDCRLRAALESRFTDESEILDVASYGCIQGINGFTYRKEINDFFNEHEEDIERWLLDEHGYTLKDFLKSAKSVHQFKTAMLWKAVDLYCQEIIVYNEMLKLA